MIATRTDVPVQLTLRGSVPPGPVVRRKPSVLERLTPEQAVVEMDLLGHDFCLYVDAADGTAAVVFRLLDGSICVLGQAGAVAGSYAYRGAPLLLTTTQATERFEGTVDRFLFYHDPIDDRPRVLYRRHDGSFGLLVGS